MPDCWEAMWLELEHNILIWNSHLHNIQYRPFNLSFQTVNQLIHFLLDSFLFHGDKIICGEKPLHKKKSCWIFTYTFHLVTPCYLWNVFDK